MGIQKVVFNTATKYGGKAVKGLLECKPSTKVKGFLEFKPLTSEAPKTLGKHKIPRFLYHITTKENYQNMLEAGSIKPGLGHAPIGVYMFELDSFAKYWCKDLKDMLIDHCGKEQDLVILKIPTKGLDSFKLKIRSQLEMFCLGNDLNKVFIKETDKFLSDYQEKYGRVAAIQKMFDMLPERYAPLKGIDVKFTSLCKQKKKKADIEFIYGEEIPISQVECIGSCNIEKDFAGKADSLKDLCKSVFEKIFKGRPEENALKNWRDSIFPQGYKYKIY